MKQIICAMLGLMLAAGAAQTANVSLDGTLSGTDSNTLQDDGDGNHGYAMDRSAGSTFYWAAGSSVSITGTVDVRGLTPGSYLQIGLVDKEQADLSLDTYNWGGYMFNNSALATFYAGTRNYARLADTNDLFSGQLVNPGTTVGVFDFALDIASDGSMELTLHGGTDVSASYTFGHRNWWDGDPRWSGGELANGSYLIAQVWFDTGNIVTPVAADFDINGVSVPEPATMTLLGLGLAGLVARRRQR